MKIIHLIDGFNKADGVGNVVTVINQIMEKIGYQTQIVNKRLDITDINSSQFSEGNCIFYHAAFSGDPLVKYLKCRKILVFHNITNPDLLIGYDEKARISCAEGLYTLSTMIDCFEYAITSSEYSARVLIGMGYPKERISIVPVLLRFDKLEGEYDIDLVNKYRDGRVNLLFTGRLYPNKKQEDIIESFANYKKIYNSSSRLFLVGEISSITYYNALKSYAAALGVEDSVIFTGKVPLAQYISYYKAADLFICMSEHEGFCIPLVEAMFFGIPVIAKNMTAVAGTLGGSGVLVDKRSLSAVPEVINRLVTNKEYRKYIIATQNYRLSQLKNNALEKKYVSVINRIINNMGNLKGRYYTLDDKLNNNGLICFSEKINRIVENEKPEIVIYGAGASGGRLYPLLILNNYKVVAFCDSNKTESLDNGISILNLATVKDMYPKALYIIAVQNARGVVDIAMKLEEEGISKDKICIFDEQRREIV